MAKTRDEIIDEILERVGDDENGVVLFDGLESAYLGVGTAFHEGGHRFYAVYSYSGIIESLMSDGMDREDAVEYYSFNIEGLYAGAQTPVILMDEE